MSLNISDCHFTLACQITMYLAGDCLLAFKGSFVFLVGYYLILIVKLWMGEPRPFWVDADINTTMCNIMFAQPDTYTFNIVFFWIYTIYMLTWKYNSKKSKVFTVFLICLVAIWFGVNTFSMAIYGLNYIHSSLLSAIMSLFYLAFCIYFDNEIMDLCEKMGFVTKSSRKLKFYTLFTAIVMFIFAAIICSGIKDTWIEHTDWLINSVDVSIFPEILTFN
jgi:hypothetical protein